MNKLVKNLLFGLWSILTVSLLLYTFVLKIKTEAELSKCRSLYEQCQAELEALNLP